MCRIEHLLDPKGIMNPGKMLLYGKFRLILSITRIPRSCDFGSEFDIGQPGEVTPYNDHARRRVSGAGKIATQASELGEIESQRA